MNLGKILLALALLSLPCGAQKLAISGKVTRSNGGVTPAPSQDVTNTEALLRYTAPDSNPCTIEISESATYTPLVHDVDTTLFSGSDQDSRAESYSSGTTRVFVAGKRRAEKAADGHWYSRALQANTLHYYRRTCTGPQITTGTFTTNNIKLGNTYSDPLPPDTAFPSTYFSSVGFAAWPEFTKWDRTDATARPEKIIDPQTGLATKRVWLPQDQPIGSAPLEGDHDFSFAAGTNWTNANNVRVDDTNSATFSGSGKDFIFLNDGIFYYGSDFITLSIKAWCSVGACSGEDNKIEACLTINGLNCWPTTATAKFQEVSLGTSALPSSFVTLGSTVPILDSWTPAGYPFLGYRDLRVQIGYVNVDGSGVVSWAGVHSGEEANYSYFNPNWGAGSKIVIGASTCTITAFTSQISLTVTPGSCSPALTVPVTGALYTGNNFGFMVRKKTTSTDQINIQYAKYTTGASLSLDWPASGSAQLCSDTLTQNSVTLENGYHCVMLSSGLPLLYWLSRDTGTSNYLGLFQVPVSGSGVDAFGGACANGGRTLKGTTPTANEHFYCTISDSETPAKIIVADCTMTTTNQSGSLSVSCTNMTLGSAGKDLHTLVTAFTASDTPAFSSADFGCALIGGQNGKLVLECRRGSDADAIGWNVIFDPLLVDTAAGCVGGGSPGCVVAAMSTWAVAPARWCVNHTTFLSGATNVVWIAGKFFPGEAKVGSGPYTSRITSGALGATGAIAAGVGLCPAGTLTCDTVTVDGEPCDTGPVGTDPLNCPKNAAYSFLQNAIVGDIFMIDNNEWVRLAVKTSTTNWTIQRSYGYRGSTTHGANADLSAFCSSQDFTKGYSNWSWNWDAATDPHGTNSGGTSVVVAWDYDHPDPHPDLTLGGDASWNTVCTTPPCYALRSTGALGDAPNRYVSLAPKFAGASGTAQYIERAQDHPGRLQNTATTAEKLWFADGRPLVAQSDISDVATPVSGQLYKLTSTTSNGDDLTAIGGAGASLGGLNRKLQPTWAACGSQPLIDISSSATGNQIGTTSSDAFKYCVTRIGGECRTGSSQGDVYVNCPNQFQQYAAKITCSGQDQSLYNDICISNMSQYLNSVNQMGFAADDYTGALGRKLSSGYSRYKTMNTYWSGQALSDASWILFPSAYGILLGKLPSFPSTDAYDRSTFIPISVTVAAGSQNNAIAKFWYAESGYCTSRLEDCYAVSNSVPTPAFKFPTDGTSQTLATVTGLSCASGCTLVIPAISGRVLYYAVVLRDASNGILSTGATQIAAVP